MADEVVGGVKAVAAALGKGEDMEGRGHIEKHELVFTSADVFAWGKDFHMHKDLMRLLACRKKERERERERERVSVGS